MYDKLYDIFNVSVPTTKSIKVHLYIHSFPLTHTFHFRKRNDFTKELWIRYGAFSLRNGNLRCNCLHYSHLIVGLGIKMQWRKLRFISYIRYASAENVAQTGEVVIHTTIHDRVCAWVEAVLIDLDYFKNYEIYICFYFLLIHIYIHISLNDTSWYIHDYLYSLTLFPCLKWYLLPSILVLPFSIDLVLTVSIEIVKCDVCMLM